MRSSLTHLLTLTIALGIQGTALAQQMTFDSPELVGGQNLEQGASYRFSNVLNGLDAVVTVDQLSQISLLNIDTSDTNGIDNAAWSPVFAGNGGDGLHYADFSVLFYAHGTNTPQTPNSFTASVYGNDLTQPTDGIMMEFVQVSGFSSVLNTSSNTQGSQPLLAAWQFDDKSGYTIRYGWQGGNGPDKGRGFSTIMTGDIGSPTSAAPVSNPSLTTAVPEPSTSLLFVLSVFPLALRRKR